MFESTDFCTRFYACEEANQGSFDISMEKRCNQGGANDKNERTRTVAMLSDWYARGMMPVVIREGNAFHITRSQGLNLDLSSQ